MYGVGSRSEGDPDGDGGRAVLRSREAVVFRAKLHTRDIPEIDCLSAGDALNDDILKFFFRRQTAGRSHDICLLDIGFRRRVAEAAKRVLAVLVLYRGGDIGGGYTQLRHLVGLEPDTHRVILICEYIDVADSGNALEPVNDVEQRVIAYIGRVVYSLRREEREDKQQVGRRLLHDDTVLADLRRYRGRGHLHAVVDVYRRLIGVRTKLKGDGENHVSLSVADRVHVYHVVDAVYLRLQRRGHDLRYDLGRRSRILRADGDLRRHKFRELRDGKCIDGHYPRDNDNY